MTEGGGGGQALGTPEAECPTPIGFLSPEASSPPDREHEKEIQAPIISPPVPRPRTVSKPSKPVKHPSFRREPRIAESPPSAVAQSGEDAASDLIVSGQNPEKSPEDGSGISGSLSRKGRGTGHGDGPIDADFGGANGPRFAKKSIPNYPRLARHQGKEGTVVLRVTIDEGGRPIMVEVLKTAGKGLDDEAVRAVKASLFHPARQEGKPAACRAILPIRFELHGSD